MEKKLPVYGDGNYTRDWLYVEDHAVAIDLIFHKGLNHETYNIGGFNEWKNIDNDDLQKLKSYKIDSIDLPNNLNRWRMLEMRPDHVLFLTPLEVTHRKTSRISIHKCD